MKRSISIDEMQKEEGQEGGDIEQGVENNEVELENINSTNAQPVDNNLLIAVKRAVLVYPYHELINFADALMAYEKICRHHYSKEKEVDVFFKELIEPFKQFIFEEDKKTAAEEMINRFSQHYDQQIGGKLSKTGRLASNVGTHSAKKMSWNFFACGTSREESASGATAPERLALRRIRLALEALHASDSLQGLMQQQDEIDTFLSELAKSRPLATETLRFVDDVIFCTGLYRQGLDEKQTSEQIIKLYSNILDVLKLLQPDSKQYQYRNQRLSKNRSAIVQCRLIAGQLEELLNQSIKNNKVKRNVGHSIQCALVLGIILGLLLAVAGAMLTSGHTAWMGLTIALLSVFTLAASFICSDKVTKCTKKAQDEIELNNDKLQLPYTIRLFSSHVQDELAQPSAVELDQEKTQVAGGRMTASSFY